MHRERNANARRTNWYRYRSLPGDALKLQAATHSQCYVSCHAVDDEAIDSATTGSTKNSTRLIQRSAPTIYHPKSLNKFLALSAIYYVLSIIIRLVGVSLDLAFLVIC